MVNAVRWLSDRAVEAGGLLDLSATLSVRTPGHPDRGHLPGWHLWYRADPACPVHMGPLPRCHAVELRARGTCPGSPGYVVWSEPDQLPVLPWWIAGLAGPPPIPVTSTRTGHGSGGGQARLHGIIGRLAAARRGERNRLLFWASARIGELVAEGDLDAAAAGQALADAAAQVGLVREDGQRAVAATIRSGFGDLFHHLIDEQHDLVQLGDQGERPPRGLNSGRECREAALASDFGAPAVSSRARAAHTLA